MALRLLWRARTVSEQPWRNPRPAPQLPEMQPRLGGLLVPAWLRTWWPAILWACLIFFLSTDTFSSDHTAWFFEPVIHWLVPSLSGEQIDFVHHIIRKSAHFTEYFIFCLLLYRAVRGVRKGWHWSWGLDGAGDCRVLLVPRRDPPSVRRQPYRFAVRFPARLYWRVLRLPGALRLVPFTQAFCAAADSRTFLKRLRCSGLLWLTVIPLPPVFL